MVTVNKLHYNESRVQNIRSLGRFHSVVSFFVVFFALTPWVSWGLNNMDSQPWPFLTSSLYLFIFAPVALKFSKSMFAFLFLLVIALITALFFSWDASFFLIVRALIGYLTVPLVLLAFFSILKKSGFPEKTVIFVNLLWILAGLVELVNPQLIAQISAQRTTLERGVTSLAPEPTFFAVFLVFVSWLLLLGRKYQLTKGILFLIILNLLSIIVLARSTMGLLYVLVLFAIMSLRFLSTLRLRSVLRILILSTVAFTAILIGSGQENSRISRITSMLASSSFYELAGRDASINVRLSHVVIPIHGLIENRLLPGGFDTFADMRSRLLDYYEGYFWYGSNTNKIMSWVGSFLYELGFIGAVVLIALLKLLWSRSLTERPYEIAALFALLFGAVPLGFSVVPLCLAVMLFNSQFASQVDIMPNRVGKLI